MFKKSLTLALSLLLVIGSFTGILVTITSADVSTNDYLNTASNWLDSAQSTLSTTTFSGAGAWYSTTESTDPTDETVSALKLYGNQSGAFGILLNLESGKDYKISFDYYSPKLRSQTTAEYCTALYGASVTLGITSANYWSDVYSRYDGASSNDNIWAGLATRGDDPNRVVNIVENRTAYTKGTNVTSLGLTANEWHSFSAEFNSGTSTTAALTLVMPGSGTNSYYIKNVKLVQVISNAVIQNFEEATVASDVGTVMGNSQQTIETVTGSDGTETKVMRFAAADNHKFTVATASNWNDGSDTSLVAEAFKVSFDLKMEWGTTGTPVVWFNFKSATNGSARVRDNAQVSDASKYSVSDLENGWKHFEFIFEKTEEETGQFFNISNLTSGTSAISFDLDNIVIEEYEKAAVFVADFVSQDFEKASSPSDAGIVMGSGQQTIETVAGGDGADTKILRFNSNTDNQKLTIGESAHWSEDSATSLSADIFKVSFDLKMEWGTTGTPVVWFNFKSATNGSARIRDNAQIADATNYYVADLQNGWKHFEFIFEKTEEEAGQFFNISNLTSGTSAISFDLDNILIEKYTYPVATGDAVALRAATGDLSKGIRVKSSVVIKEIDSQNIVEYGSLITMASLTNGMELKADAPFTVLKGVAFDKSTEKDIYYEMDDTTKIFTAVLVNINPASFGEDILVRSYAKTSDGKYIYGDTLTFSVYDVVDAILSGDNADDIAVANTYVSEAISAAETDASIVTYADWKATN